MTASFTALDFEELFKLEHAPRAARPALGALVENGLARMEPRTRYVHIRVIWSVSLRNIRPRAPPPCPAAYKQDVGPSPVSPSSP